MAINLTVQYTYNYFVGNVFSLLIPFKIKVASELFVWIRCGLDSGKLFDYFNTQIAGNTTTSKESHLIHRHTA